MNYRLIFKTTGRVMLIEAVAMIPSLICALIYREDVLPFVISIAVLAALYGLFSLIKPKLDHFFAKDAFVCVCLIWLMLSLFGALPFALCGGFDSFVDCFFESVSGFTTTGASILPEVEHLPKSILFWRSFTHFIGGMGVLVLASALTSGGKDRSQHLMRAEVPGPTSDKLVPKLSQSSKILYLIYAGMTVVEIVLLLTVARMDLFDSLTLSFGTAGTGGFAVTNGGIGGYGNAAAEWIIAVFMFLFSINFTVHFLLLTGKVKKAFETEELRFYGAFVFIAVSLIVLNTLSYYDNVGDNIRSAFFTVASIASTTGYGTVDTNVWPQFAKTIVILLMAMGAMAGSTGGGMKCSRVVMVCKSVAQEIRQIIHPNAVKIVRMDGRRVDDGTVMSGLRFMLAYVLITFGSALIVSLDGHDFETTFTAALSAISNIGPGFGKVGTTGNFAFFSPLSKIVLILDMIIGRLEIFPVLIFFSPYTWRKR